MSQAPFIEPAGAKDFDNCPCCGRNSRRVWGYISTGDRTVAAYFVHWTRDHVQEHGANVDLIIGQWGEDAPNSNRCAVALEYRLLDSGPTFRVIDSDQRDIATSDLVGRALRRDEVIGQPLTDEVFSYCDLILAEDDRVVELLGRK